MYCSTSVSRTRQKNKMIYNPDEEVEMSDKADVMAEGNSEEAEPEYA